MSESAGEVLSRTILKMGGKKTLGHKWQWRRAVILIEAKLRYWDAKTEQYRGEFSLEGAECVMISEKDEMFAKLAKLKKPKAPEGVVDIPNPTYFSVKPRDSLKTYYFGVPNNERALWIGYMNDARDGMTRFREALRLKRGATASVSSSSANLMGNLQPLGSPTALGNTSSAGGVASPSGSVSSQESLGSYTSLGPSSGRSFQSNNSIQSNNSARSNTTNSSTDNLRQTTIEGGMMPGTLAHHSASAPPARQFNIVVSPAASPLTSLTPRPAPLDDDPFGLSAARQYEPVSQPLSNLSIDSPASGTQSPSLGNSTSSNPSAAAPIDAPVPTSSPFAPSLPTSDYFFTTSGNSNPGLLPLLGSSASSVSSTSTTTSPVLSPSVSPAPTGTTIVTVMPQPILFNNSTSIRDSFVFDSAM